MLCCIRLHCCCSSVSCCHVLDTYAVLKVAALGRAALRRAVLGKGALLHVLELSCWYAQSCCRSLVGLRKVCEQSAASNAEAKITQAM